MRKTLALLLATAFVATLPSLASAKGKRHHRRHAPVVMQPVDSNEAGPRLLGNALHQLIVPLEVTFAPQPQPEPVLRHRKRHRTARS
jgi:hypothetical protein